MFYKLHEKLLLRGWQKLPYAVVEKGVSRPLFITAKEMQALQLCNGLIDTSLPLVPQEIRELLGQIEKRGLITRWAPGGLMAVHRICVPRDGGHHDARGRRSVPC